MTDVRAAIVNWARWGEAHRSAFTYQEVRPMHLSGKLPWTGDCSSFVTLCYWLAGAPDPNQANYDGWGYTGSLLQHGQHIDLAHVQPGDVIVYGPGTGWHTAVVVEGGADPLTVSMGEQGDPSLVRVSQDGREPQTYLRFATNSRFPTPKPKPVPPPAKGKPTKAQIVTAHLVQVRPLGQRQAVKNHWHLWYFSETHFVAVIGKAPAGVRLYANVNFRKKA